MGSDARLGGIDSSLAGCGCSKGFSVVYTRAEPKPLPNSKTRYLFIFHDLRSTEHFAPILYEWNIFFLLTSFEKLRSEGTSSRCRPRQSRREGEG
jgi:hypothetical protein